MATIYGQLCENSPFRENGDASGSSPTPASKSPHYLIGRTSCFCFLKEWRHRTVEKIEWHLNCDPWWAGSRRPRPCRESGARLAMCLCLFSCQLENVRINFFAVCKFMRILWFMFVVLWSIMSDLRRSSVKSLFLLWLSRWVLWSRWIGESSFNNK